MLGIALPIREQLPAPQLRVGLREVRVLLAVMPEAAVDEDRDACPGEDEIGTGAGSLADPAVDEEPAAAGVQESTDGEFRSGVAPAEARHVQSTMVGRLPVLHPSTVGSSSRR